MTFLLKSPNGELIAPGSQQLAALLIAAGFQVAGIQTQIPNGARIAHAGMTSPFFNDLTPAVGATTDRHSA